MRAVAHSIAHRQDNRNYQDATVDVMTDANTRYVKLDYRNKITVKDTGFGHYSIYSTGETLGGRSYVAVSLAMCSGSDSELYTAAFVSRPKPVIGNDGKEYECYFIAEHVQGYWPGNMRVTSVSVLVILSENVDAYLIGSVGRSYNAILAQNSTRGAYPDYEMRHCIKELDITNQRAVLKFVSKEGVVSLHDVTLARLN